MTSHSHRRGRFQSLRALWRKTSSFCQSCPRPPPPRSEHSGVKLRNETLIVCRSQLAQVWSALMGNNTGTTGEPLPKKLQICFEREDSWNIIIFVYLVVCLASYRRKIKKRTWRSKVGRERGEVDVTAQMFSSRCGRRLQGFLLLFRQKTPSVVEVKHWSQVITCGSRLVCNFIPKVWDGRQV